MTYFHKREAKICSSISDISDDEDENTTDQVKEDIIYLPEHPKQGFKTELRQESIEVVENNLTF